MTEQETRLVTLTRVNDEVAGALVVSTLEEAGIKATLTGVFTAGFRAEAPGYVDVVVNENDLARARKLIESMKLEHPVDWSKVDVGDPEE